ncbi:hypothetical protein BST81_07640 [Leptolyngbya sp. 'hensonii']|uniref:phospholipid carrier-dependent glycosyltransferase n=1 Tax=Leptolyngbya sp. 'hensonii' TaxID=1922337 RepID=UPI00094F6D78|nr:phospholipid carrier-dependent glycosyltransferase [Leptolyngbya sp. 'hensonii']OLP19075.1 hypothetical protein BST81_07640 [Leptolyngbya sp. 'hensonii']
MTSQTALEPSQPALQEERDRRVLYSALGIFAIALLFRFWLLGYVTFPVFDEVYFPTYAEEYLQGKAPWEGHPPLAKYFILLAILLLGKNVIGYRIASAITGAIIPVLVMGLAYRLTGRLRVAVLAGFFTLADGLFLVESRLGLINVFLVACGLVAQILLLVGLERQGQTRTLILCLSGLMLGASASVKWNGLGFFLMTALLAGLVWIIALLRPESLPRLGLLARFTELRWWQYLLCFGVMPIGFYGLVWVPHILESPDYFAPQSVAEVLPQFWKTLVNAQIHMIWWHNSTEVIPKAGAEPVHPYCSAVLSWPVLARGITYYFQLQGEQYQVINALGNPILWWLSTLAIGALSIAGLRQIQPATAFVLIGYAANYLPWLIVKRCLFLYHYMSAAVFSFIALALVSDWLLRYPRWRYLALTGIGAIGLCYLYFLPIWLGLPISSAQFYQRMWTQWLHIPGFDWI